MANINEAFQPEGGINLDDLVGIFAGTIDPAVIGEAAPIGSMFLRSTGSAFIKTGANDTDWAMLGTGGGGGVKISSTDTTADVLNAKLLVASTLSKSIQNSGANETLTLDLANVGTAGTYSSVTTNAKGQVISGTNPGFLTANQTITLSGAVTGSGSTSIVTTLANSGVVAGTYNYATITVTNKGIVTSAVNNTVVTSVAATGSTGLTVGGSPITTTGTLSLTLDTGLQNLASFTGTGLVVATGTDTWAPRTLTAGSAKISITNGTGAAGNPTVDLGTVTLDDLSNVVAPTPTVGASLRYDGTNWTPIGGDGVGGSLRTWAGAIGSQSGTTQFAMGVTPPTTAGGTQVASQTITPLTVNSRYIISLSLSCSASSNNHVHTCALFRNGTYIGASVQTFTSGGNSNALTFLVSDQPATTSPITYTIRYGTTAGTWYLNRRSAEDTYGGMRSGWQIQEY